MPLSSYDIEKTEAFRTETEHLGNYLLEVVRQRVYGDVTAQDELVRGSILQSQYHTLIDDYQPARPTETAIAEAQNIQPQERAYFTDLRSAALKLKVAGRALVEMAQADNVEALVGNARSEYETKVAEARQAADPTWDQSDARKQTKHNLDDASLLLDSLEVGSLLSGRVGEFISTERVPLRYRQNVATAVRDSLNRIDDMGLAFDVQTHKTLQATFPPGGIKM